MLFNRQKQDEYLWCEFNRNNKSIYRIFKCDGRNELGNCKWIYSNGINIVIFKIQKLVTKTRRGRRRNNRRGTYKKNYWVQEI